MEHRDKGSSPCLCMCLVSCRLCVCLPAAIRPISKWLPGCQGDESVTGFEGTSELLGYGKPALSPCVTPCICGWKTSLAPSVNSGGSGQHFSSQLKIIQLKLSKDSLGLSRCRESGAFSASSFAPCLLQPCHPKTTGGSFGCY